MNMNMIMINWNEDWRRSRGAWRMRSVRGQRNEQSEWLRILEKWNFFCRMQVKYAPDFPICWNDMLLLNTVFTVRTSWCLRTARVWCNQSGEDTTDWAMDNIVRSHLPDITTPPLLTAVATWPALWSLPCTSV